VLRTLSGEFVTGARKWRQKADELDFPLLEALLTKYYGHDQHLLYAI
jgi:hypothetical protein